MVEIVGETTEEDSALDGDVVFTSVAKGKVGAGATAGVIDLRLPKAVPSARHPTMPRPMPQIGIGRQRDIHLMIGTGSHGFFLPRPPKSSDREAIILSC